MNITDWAKNGLFAAVCIGSIGLLSAALIKIDRIKEPDLFQSENPSRNDIESVVAQVDRVFSQQWLEQGLTPADPVDSLTVARRLSLGLSGTIPSLEEIREIEKQSIPDQLPWWISRLLEDRRTSNYLAERLARALVGVEDGPFVIYRRRRFVSWLADEFESNRPYDVLVRRILTAKGLWTDMPAVNFYTRTIVQDSEDPRPDPIQLASRTSRAFLGMRIDCLQCHDDFLGNVNLGSATSLTAGTQRDFHSLAAFFQQSENSLLGVCDRPQRGPYVFKLLDQSIAQPMAPMVPFLPELLDRSEPNPRKQLAGWVTHPGNRPFARATVNRVWALLFGQALMQSIDDIPLAGPFPPALEILVDDFVQHGYDLQRLIRVIAATRVFSLDSAVDFPVTSLHESNWAMFPLVRLRPEQVAGAITQSTKLTTLDAASHVLTRVVQFGQQNDFVTRFGDLGENEFQDRGETITQRLLLLNGDMLAERLNSPLDTPLHLSQLSTDLPKIVEIIYLSTLTRRPNLEEQARFVAALASQSPDQRDLQAVDIYWALVNSAEFHWNH